VYLGTDTYVFYSIYFIYVYLAGKIVLATGTPIAHFCRILRDVWILTQRAAVTGRRATILPAHLSNLDTHLSIHIEIISRSSSALDISITWL